MATDRDARDRLINAVEDVVETGRRSGLFTEGLAVAIERLISVLRDDGTSGDAVPMCSNCQHFVFQYGKFIGRCQRYPPTLDDGNTVWPIVQRDWGCGEWSPVGTEEGHD